MASDGDFSKEQIRLLMQKLEEAEKAREEAEKKREEAEKKQEEERKAREEERKAREEERKKREEVEKAREDERKKREEVEKDLAAAKKSIVREGLPELAPVTSSASGIPSKNEAHEQATIVFDENRPFGVFNNLRDKLDTSLQSRVWVNITAEKHPARNVLPLQVNDELTIQEYVSQVLKDIIGTLSNVLRVQVVVQKEMQFNGQKADLWVLLAMGVPIGVVEVKKSGSSPNDMKVSSTKKVGFSQDSWNVYAVLLGKAND